MAPKSFCITGIQDGWKFSTIYFPELLRPAAFEDIYLLHVAREVSIGHFLKTNQLPDIEQLLNTNQQRFL